MGESPREQRFLELVEGNRGRLARVARAYAGPEWTDLHQEILLQVWRGLDRFEGRSSAATWLYRVALNTAMTWRRRQSRNAARPAATFEAELDRPAPSDSRDPVRVLDEFLASLEKPERALLLLYLEDLSYREMADILGVSESYVGVKLNRLKQAFIQRHVRG